MKSESKPTLTIETITPEIAQRYLDTSKGNRALRTGNLNFYVRQMRAGKWRLCHQGIAFSTDGDLIDGHHRLTAVIMSGVAVQMSVSRSFPVDSSEVIDQPGVRNACDVWKLNPNVSKVMALAGFMVNLRKPQELAPIVRSPLKHIAERLIQSTSSNRIVVSSTGVRLAVVLLANESPSSEGVLFERYRTLVLQRYNEMTPSMQAFNRNVIGKNWAGRSCTLELMARAVCGFGNDVRVERATDAKLNEIKEWAREEIKKAIGGAQ